jgi:RimJ/RimL family protein N-acetyltransferase
MTIIETERLRLRQLTLDDAEFILRLLNEPSFIENVGDKQVRTLTDSQRYIESGPMSSYYKFGFGLWLLEVKDSNVPIGICGLIKREALPEVDLGYALVPEFWARGYALESALGVISYARKSLGLKRVLAITSVHNERSIRVLDKSGFRFQRMIKMVDSEPELKLFAADL